MNKFVTMNQDLSANIKKGTILIKPTETIETIFLHTSSCDQLSLQSEYHVGIF